MVQHSTRTKPRDAMRQVAAGPDVPHVTMSQRAAQALRNLRASHGPHVDSGVTVLVTRDAAWHTWWTWAGGRGNLTLTAALDGADPGLIADEGRASDFTLRVAADAGAVRLRQALAVAEPDLDANASITRWPGRRRSTGPGSRQRTNVPVRRTGGPCRADWSVAMLVAWVHCRFAGPPPPGPACSSS